MTDLDQVNFEVFEDGVKQELILFNRTNLPIALSLLIDTSSSMEDRMSSAQEAAVGFAQIKPRQAPQRHAGLEQDDDGEIAQGEEGFLRPNVGGERRDETERG